MSQVRSILDERLDGLRVLVRADLNVPIRDDRVADATRIDKFAPTVAELTQRGARVIVMTHLGRPPYDRKESYSNRLLVDDLARATGRPVILLSDDAPTVPPGSVGLLENLRFDPGEMANSDQFAGALARMGDVYVNDAFSCAHRAHASTDAITRYLPSFAGPSLLRELRALAAALETPERPVAGIIGGAKISTKIDVIGNLISRLDHLVVGGGMANTFLKAKGRMVGRSLVEPDYVEVARAILNKAEKAGCEIVLPVDAVLARDLAAGAEHWVVPADQVPADAMILDVGPNSVKALKSLMNRCRTVLWNGPLGAFEVDPFGEGTFELARHVADLTEQGRLLSVAGGGDTVAALNTAGATERFSYVSTAGGAFLEWLEGKELPAIEKLKQGNSRQTETK